MLPQMPATRSVRAAVCRTRLVTLGPSSTVPVRTTASPRRRQRIHRCRGLPRRVHQQAHLAVAPAGHTRRQKDHRTRPAVFQPTGSLPLVSSCFTCDARKMSTGLPSHKKEAPHLEFVSATGAVLRWGSLVSAGGVVVRDIQFDLRRRHTTLTVLARASWPATAHHAHRRFDLL